MEMNKGYVVFKTHPVEFDYPKGSFFYQKPPNQYMVLIYHGNWLFFFVNNKSSPRTPPEGRNSFNRRPPNICIVLICKIWIKIVFLFVKSKKTWKNYTNQTNKYRMHSGVILYIVRNQLILQRCQSFLSFIGIPLKEKKKQTFVTKKS